MSTDDDKKRADKARELAEFGRQLARCDHQLESTGGNRRRCVKCDRTATLQDGLVVWDR